MGCGWGVSGCFPNDMLLGFHRNSLEVYDLDSRFQRNLKVPFLGVSLPLANVELDEEKGLRAGT